jgi:hypothetical protein
MRTSLPAYRYLEAIAAFVVIRRDAGLASVRHCAQDARTDRNNALTD